MIREMLSTCPCCRLLGETHFYPNEIIPKGRHSFNQRLIIGSDVEMIEVHVRDPALYFR